MDTTGVHQRKSWLTVVSLYLSETAFVFYVIAEMVDKTNSNLMAIMSIKIKL